MAILYGIWWTRIKVLFEELTVNRMSEATNSMWILTNMRATKVSVATLFRRSIRA